MLLRRLWLLWYVRCYCLIDTWCIIDFNNCNWCSRFDRFAFFNAGRTAVAATTPISIWNWIWIACRTAMRCVTVHRYAYPVISWCLFQMIVQFVIGLALRFCVRVPKLVFVEIVIGFGTLPKMTSVYVFILIVDGVVVVIGPPVRLYCISAQFEASAVNQTWQMNKERYKKNVWVMMIIN